jgi:hypothetical protein
MNTWNPWKLTTIGLALCIAVGLVTGLVVANWGDPSQPAAARTQAPAPARIKAAPRPAASAAAPAPARARAPQRPSGASWARAAAPCTG